jgi:hypothetical protein
MARREAEERSVRYKEGYEFRADSAAEVGERTDLDKTRKGQIPHDLAT